MARKKKDAETIVETVLAENESTLVEGKDVEKEAPIVENTSEDASKQMKKSAAQKKKSKAEPKEEPKEDPISKPDDKPIERPAKRKRRFGPAKSTFRNGARITINAEDKYSRKENDTDLLANDIIASYDNNIHKVLTGKITAVTVQPGKDGLRMLFHVKYKNKTVYIKAEDFYPKGEIEKYSGEAKLAERFMAKRINSEIDFRVIDIITDQGNKNNINDATIVGSRVLGMMQTRNKFWNGTAKEKGKTVDLIRVGSKQQARIVATVQAGIFVEVFGVETFIANNELSYSFLANAMKAPNNEFTVGKIIDVVILSINKENKQNITFHASYKAGLEDPRENAFKELQEDSMIIGTVTNVVRDLEAGVINVFVNYQNEIDIMCKMGIGVKEIPMIGDGASVKILGKNHDEMRIWGYIDHRFPQ